MINKILFIILIFINTAFADKLVVEFVKVPTTKQISALKVKYSVAFIKKFDNFNSDYFKRLYIFEAIELNKIKIIEEKSIKKIEEIYSFESLSIVPSKTTSFPLDPLSNYQWNIENNGQMILTDIDDIHSKEVLGVKGFDIGLKNVNKNILINKKDVLVAVLDTGVDIEHADLKDVIFKNTAECDADGNLPFKPEEDKDGNGFIGDCMGWNFTTDKEGKTLRAHDDKGHGTHVAGIIAAKWDNGIGIRGVSPNVKILPIKVLRQKEGKGGKGALSFSDRLAKGILYAIKMKAQVINMSLGWPKSMDTEYLRNAIKEAIKANITVVAAAGNNNTFRPLFPCSYKDVICVGSLNIDNTVSSFSNYGGAIDILAPGEQIISTFPNKFDPILFSIQGYEVKNGTSQAAPAVSGIVAWLKSNFPNITEDEVKARLYYGSSKIYQDKPTLAGAISLNKALSYQNDGIIKPIFKESHQATVDLKQGLYTYEFPVKHYFGKSVAGNISIRFLNSKINSTKKLFNFDLKAGESTLVKLDGKILDVDINSDNWLEVEISSEGIIKKYKHLVSFVSEIKNVNSKSFVIKAKKEDIAIDRKGKIFPKIQTITSYLRQSLSPEYFYVIESDKGIEVNVLSINGSNFESNKLFIEDGTKVISFHKVDLNNDGSEDYFIRSVGQKEKAKFLIYTMIKKDLSPILGKASFNFTPSVTILNTEDLSFIPYETSLGTINVPAQLSIGKIPKDQLDPDPWAQEDTGKAVHLYSFVPNIEKGIIETKIIDNYIFRKEIVNKMNKGDTENWNWILSPSGSGVSKQNINDLKIGLIDFYFAHGDLLNRKISILKLSKNLKWEIEDTNLEPLLVEGAFSLESHAIGIDKVSYNNGISFTGLINDGLAQTYFMSAKDNRKELGVIRYQHQRKSDHILGFKSTFTKNGTLYSFYQTKGQLIAQVTDNTGTEKVHRTPLHRVSFLPGRVFNELSYPVVAQVKKEIVPAFYVDATQLNTGHIYLLKLTETGFISPIKHNIKVKGKCRPLNPVSINNVGHMTLFCEKNPTTFELKYIEF
jgi:cell wall-associated protease